MLADLTPRQRYSKGKTARCPLDRKMGKAQNKPGRCEEDRFEVLCVMTIYILPIFRRNVLSSSSVWVWDTGNTSVLRVGKIYQTAHDPPQETDNLQKNCTLIGFEPPLVDRPAHGQIIYTDCRIPTPTILLIFPPSDPIWNNSEHHTHIQTKRTHKFLVPPVRNHNCASVSAYDVYRAAAIK